MRSEMATECCTVLSQESRADMQQELMLGRDQGAVLSLSTTKYRKFISFFWTSLGIEIHSFGLLLGVGFVFCCKTLITYGIPPVHVHTVCMAGGVLLGSSFSRTWGSG